ncbi:hypothetical protein FQN60_017276 [Etheostoma spectabile]|uniref:C-mannosyltransferase DPY19L1 n=1 Tax=Etheostoma spectabile TaxID=54343 RepID=A0A5J5DF08_9PERO|nr:hypothetical protein FQN60_017276 [Etheostoma spectabile]
MPSYGRNCFYSGNGQPNPFCSIIRPIDRGGSVRPPWTNRGPGFVASCPHVFLDARGPQLLVRAPRASILLTSPPRFISPSAERQVNRPTALSREARDSNARGQEGPSSNTADPRLGQRVSLPHSTHPHPANASAMLWHVWVPDITDDKLSLSSCISSSFTSPGSATSLRKHHHESEDEDGAFVLKGQIRGADTSNCGAAWLAPRRVLPQRCLTAYPRLFLEIMMAKNRKQSGKSPATQTDRDKSPLVSPPGKSNVRRPGREGKAFNSSHPNGLSGITHKLGLTPSAAVKLGITLLLAALTGYLHWHHLSQLFENDRHFSHLSNLEKEMAFRTEMGLYYSYYKTIIEAPSFLDGLHMVMNDRLTEYPLVVLAGWYRMYTGGMGYFGIPTKMCWTINRGEGLSPVDSCEGMGDPAYFYVAFVFLLNGAMMSLFFIYGAYLSGSRLGGVVTTMCFFFNHGESTRVMWTPPLRESFAYPFLVLQMLLLTYILRTRNPSRTAMVALGISNLCFMLPWQFAQFVLLTQVASLFASYILGYLGAAKMQSILRQIVLIKQVTVPLLPVLILQITLGVCFILMFGNAMLLTSFYASSLVSIWAIIALRDRFAQVFKPGVVIWLMQGLAWVGFTVLLKFMLSTVLSASDDAHISALIKSKFTSYKDFHTLMYTCAAEFDFMELETPIRYLKTLLLPINVLVVAVIAWKTIQDIVRFLRDGGKASVKPDDADEASGSEIAAKGEVRQNTFHILYYY